MSFSFVLGGIPLLFILATIGSFVVKENLVSIVELEFFGFLPADIRGNIVGTITTYASSPGSLSVVSVAILLIVVNTFFFDIYRTFAATLGTPFRVAHGRLWAMLLNTLFLILIYVATLVTPAGKLIARSLEIPPLGITIAARSLAVLVIATALWGVVHVVAQEAFPRVKSLIVLIIGSIVWQLVYSAGSLVIGFSENRFFMYGVLAWAVFYLTYMRIFSEIIVQCGLWIYVLREQPRAAPSDAPHDAQ